MDAGGRDRIARAIIDELVARLGDEVELVFRYGSFVRGDGHRWSDVDMSYVPRDPSRGDSITVLVDDILYDLYPLHWETLARMAEWDDWRATILHDYEIVYEADARAAERFHRLAERHAELERPEARPAMVAKALAAFERVGYDVYLLERSAKREDIEAAHRHVSQVVQTVLHALVLLNQSRADTRRLEQMAALADAPRGLTAMVGRIVAARTCGELEAATHELLERTREVLLRAQARHLRVSADYAERLNAAYPELRADLQRVIIACERGDAYAAHTKLVSFLHELHVHLAQVEHGVAFGAFNTPSEYRHPLRERGFPDPTPALVAGRFADLAELCVAFDRRLRDYLGELGVGLNSFESLDELQVALREGRV